MSKRFILVGADPYAGTMKNPGGQATASIGLNEYVLSIGGVLEFIDTTQGSFPLPQLRVRIWQGVRRFGLLFRKLLNDRYTGIIVFSGAGFSFYERTVICLIARLFGVKSVLFLRDGHFFNVLKSGWLIQSITRFFLKTPSLVGVQGNAWVTLLKALDVNSNAIVSVANWLPPGFPVQTNSKKLIASDRLRFIFVGWIVKEKGIVELFEATKRLLKEHEFEMTFVGDGSLREWLNDSVDAYGLSEEIRVTGWQKPNEVRGHLERAHVFILPSHAEGFPNALLEAMAFGLPAICTNVGAVSDSLRNDINGCLLSNGSVDEIEGAMRSYLENPDLVSIHSAASIAIVKSQHDMKRNCEQLLSCFE